MGELSHEATLNTLRNATGFIKRSLAKRVRLKYMPKLIFEYDESIDYGFKIDEILKEIKKEDEEKGR